MIPSTPAETSGRGDTYTDPLWGIRVDLRPVERALLRTPQVRRLHFVAHAGAARLVTPQTYSRLEHSLGTLALVAHFRPEDDALRAAALLHDVGHLPYSHTLEGLGGLDHHALGRDRIRALASHLPDPEAVLAALDGPNPLTGEGGLLSLDHLDSYVRSGRANGWLTARPADLLARLRVTGAAVDTDAGTAAVLVDLIGAEARSHTSWDNVAPVAILRRLVAGLTEEFAHLTDDELWSVLQKNPTTAAEAARLRQAPHQLAARAVAAGDHNYALRKIYRSEPLVDGRRLADAAPALAALLAELDQLPRHFHVAWSDAAR